MALIINADKTPEKIKKALEQLEQRTSGKRLKDSFGKLPGAYGHTLSYQRKLRKEDWALVPFVSLAHDYTFPIAALSSVLF